MYVPHITVVFGEIVFCEVNGVILFDGVRDPGPEVMGHGSLTHLIPTLSDEILCTIEYSLLHYWFCDNCSNLGILLQKVKLCSSG